VYKLSRVSITDVGSVLRGGFFVKGITAMIVSVGSVLRG